MNKTLAKLCYHLMLQSGLVGNLGNSFSFRVCSECVSVCVGGGGEGGGGRRGKEEGRDRARIEPSAYRIYLSGNVL